MKLIGKLEDGTVFIKKGHNDDGEPLEFRTEEGTSYFISAFSLPFCCLPFS